VRRRDFIKVIACSAGAWPLIARAQQGERVPRIGVLMPNAAGDPLGQTRLDVFVKELQRLGWTDGRNLRIDTRWGSGDVDQYRKYAAELVALAPDVMLTSTSVIVAAVQQATRSVPIVFAAVVDPVGAGFVASLARPGGNTTGFALFEFGISAKWLSLLKEIVPGVTRTAVLRDPAIAIGMGLLGAIQAAAPSVGVELTPLDIRDESDLERAVAEFARAPNSGVIVTPSPAGQVRRHRLVALMARYRLPTVYPFGYFPAAGGLISYGPKIEDAFRPAAGYVDRILKGENPADLPVQAPDKYDLVVNLKTASALDLTVPPAVLARADEVIE